MTGGWGDGGLGFRSTGVVPETPGYLVTVSGTADPRLSGHRYRVDV